jgi:UDP-N-acetylglucosamine--N-acetylmuramyl-(pentapeptide) pyrophosphoryl-undecaprenol N-acetylglucosamine transferase
MESFYATCDLVVARAGGAVAELTATATPSIVVPGQFGSAGHQTGNARFLTEAGAAITLEESSLDTLPAIIEEILFLSPERLIEMRGAARRIARPDAARVIAQAMLGAST